MPTRRIPTVLALASLCGPGDLPAQGGRYRGPGDLVVLPGDPKPPQAAIPRALQGAVPIGDDLSTWPFWWEFHRDQLVGRRPAGRRGGVTARHVDGQVLPALRRALQVDDAGVQAAALVALAKCAQQVAAEPLRRLIVPRLASRSQRVRETAALALGITGAAAAIADLQALATDTGHGRQLCQAAAVHPRTRAFAGYALGLVAGRSPALAVKRQAWQALHGVLNGPDTADSPDLAIAAMLGMALLDPESVERPEGRLALRDQALASLELFGQRPATSPDTVRGHLLPAIARLLGSGDSARHTRHQDHCIARLQPPGVPGTVHQRRGAVIALGRLAAPADRRCAATLQRVYQTEKDVQCRYLALMGLGRIGGAANREFLLGVLRKGRKALERPWAALALATMATHRRTAGDRAQRRATATDTQPDEALGKELVAQLAATRIPQTRSAYVIALGLCRHRAAAPLLRQHLLEYRTQDQYAGALCLGLALLEDRAAQGLIRDLVIRSVRRPEILREATPALARYGDPADTRRLVGLLGQAAPTQAQASALAQAVGALGDPAALAPLIALTDDATLPPAIRAYAVGALGELAATDHRPFHAALGDGLNYRAAVATLLHRGTGVLEFL